MTEFLRIVLDFHVSHPQIETVTEKRKRPFRYAVPEHHTKAPRWAWFLYRQH